MPIFRDFRVVLYAVPLVSSGYHVAHEYVAEWEHFPFGPAYQPLWQVLYGRSAAAPLRRFKHTFVSYP